MVFPVSGSHPSHLKQLQHSWRNQTPKPIVQWVTNLSESKTWSLSSSHQLMMVTNPWLPSLQLLATGVHSLTMLLATLCHVLFFEIQDMLWLWMQLRNWSRRTCCALSLASNWRSQTLFRSSEGAQVLLDLVLSYRLKRQGLLCWFKMFPTDYQV